MIGCRGQVKIRKYADWAIYIDIMGMDGPEGIRCLWCFANSVPQKPESSLMNTPHPRSPSIIRRPHLAGVPTTHEQALDRRRELDAQQRAFRDQATPPEPASPHRPG
jgi:hypothetical protein